MPDIIIESSQSTPSGPAGGDLTGAYPNPTITAGAVTSAKIAQTLTSKTLISPNVGTSILDGNGNTWIGQSAAAGAVNYPQLASAATGSGVALAASGTDASINLNLQSKGTGVVQVNGTPIVGAQPATAALASDVALTPANAFVSGPNLSIAAGTWLISATLSFVSVNLANSAVSARIWNGTVAAVSSQFDCASGSQNGNIGLSTIVTIGATTTFTLQATSNLINGGASGLIKAATTTNSSGNNATQISAVRMA